MNGSEEAGNNEIFSLKSYYEKLLVKEEVDFPRNLIWIPKVPRQLCLFTWLAIKGVILTAEKLRKRKVTYVSWCYMCKANVGHLLLYRQVVTRLWWEILRWFGIGWVMPDTIKELMFSWNSGK